MSKILRNPSESFVSVVFRSLSGQSEGLSKGWLGVSIFRGFRRLPRDRPWLGVALGAGLLAFAVLVRLTFGRLEDAFGPMTLLPAILLAGLFGGIQVGMGVAAVCALLGWLMYFPPYGTLTLSVSHVIAMMIFVSTATLQLYVIRVLKVANSDLREAREHANTLFRELQHRVANNLQTVAALLRLRRKALEPDSSGAAALEAALTRLEMMSRVHRRLHDPASVDQPVEHYLQALCRDLIGASDTPDIQLSVRADSIHLGLDALMSVSQIVAELVTNSLKHAFRGRSSGVLTIDFKLDRGSYVLVVADDGPGLPPDFGQTKSGSLGQGILQSLTTQLRGRMAFGAGPGVVAKLSFPAKPQGQ